MRRNHNGGGPHPVGSVILAGQRYVDRNRGRAVVLGDKLLLLEAMKMQTTVYAQADGVVSEAWISEPAGLPARRP